MDELEFVWGKAAVLHALPAEYRQKSESCNKTNKAFRILVKPIKVLKIYLWSYCISTLAPPPALSHFVQKDRGEKQQQSLRHSHLSLGYEERGHILSQNQFKD